METKELVGNKYVNALYTDINETFESVKMKIFPLSYDSANFPINKQALWLKFEIVNLDSQNRTFYLYCKTAYYTVYQETDTGWNQEHNGYLMPLKERTYKKTTRFLPLSIKPYQTSKLYVKLQSGDLAYSNYYPKIGDQIYYYETLNKQQKFSSPATVFSLIYFSGILMITFFVFILYVSIREKVYLYYLLYLFFQIIFSFIVFGRTPLKIINIALYYPSIAFLITESVQFIFIGFYILFIIYLLEIKQPKSLEKSLRLFSWFCFGYAAFSLIMLTFFPSPEMKSYSFIIIRLIVLPINLLFIIWIIKKIKHPLIPYFILGNLFFFIGSILSVSVSFLGLHKNPESIFHFGNSLNTIFQMGLLGEVFCFSFAIAHRVRLIQKEKEVNALALIRQLQENKLIQERMNKELDEKINQKTNELIKVYSDIEKQREKEIKLEFSQKINELEMMALRTQMNPHFLFNSMNAIKHLILTNRPEDAMFYLDDFSSLLRSVLKNSKRETITVEDELEILKLYLSLEKSRLGDDLQYKIDVHDYDSLSQYPIPGLLLQPFVENAIWHGLSPSDKEEKLLIITFETKEDTLIISIKDNGIGRAASKKFKNNRIRIHQSYGLQISQDRIALFNHTHNMKIHLKIIDLMKNGVPEGTLITFTYSFKKL
ncbi:MAG TPA: histidine kinase [Edaphocola sp.]|nr:histidine kinase [Edaphocola sp.]